MDIVSGSESCLIFLSLVFGKNPANDKEARQDDRVQAYLLSYLSKELLIFS